MQLNTQYQSLPPMNEQSSKGDKTLEKIAAARQVGMEDNASRAISSMMKSDISGFSQGFMNANDGISMMQIADGALSKLSDQAQTLNDLSVRYNNAALSETDKQGLEKQFQRTLTSMEQITGTTSYNGQQLFPNNLSFSVGEGTLTASMPNITTNALDIKNQDSVKGYTDMLATVQSDVGSAGQGFQSAANNLLGQITQMSAAKSQISDTDMAKAITEFQRSNNQLDSAVLTSAHQTQFLRESIGRLLG